MRSSPTEGRSPEAAWTPKRRSKPVIPSSHTYCCTSTPRRWCSASDTPAASGRSSPERRGRPLRKRKTRIKRFSSTPSLDPRLSALVGNHHKAFAATAGQSVSSKTDLFTQLSIKIIFIRFVCTRFFLHSITPYFHAINVIGLLIL